MSKKKTLRSGFAGGLLLVIALGLFLGVKALSSQAAGAASAWPTVKQGNTGENVYSVQLLLQACPIPDKDLKSFEQSSVENSLPARKFVSDIS